MARLNANGSGIESAERALESLDRGALLLTGATGLVGEALIPLLRVAHPRRPIVALTRNPATFDAVGVLAIRADLSLPGLGLSTGMRALLRDRVTQIVHSAADIRFRITVEESRQTNVAGTQEMLALAAECKHLERFLQVSTIYAAGKTPGTIYEEPLDGRAGFVNAYQQTKNEAEALVLEAMGRIPAAIARLSSLIGASSGRVHQFNYFHQTIKAIPWNPLPAIPADPTAIIDMAASDWTGRALHYLYEHCFEPGRIYHVCAGPERAWSVAQLLDSTYEVFESHHPTLRLRRRPRMVTFDEFERVLAKIRHRIPSALDQWLDALFSFLPHLSMQQRFDNSRTEPLLARQVPFPSLDSYYKQVVEYCVASNWGRSEPEPEPVMARV
ncbi:MAG: SDR family oxidoreductase [Bryobacterales bacterium]|nr:SDR family oxidoreductase [Bryobacterales bacterium]